MPYVGGAFDYVGYGQSGGVPADTLGKKLKALGQRAQLAGLGSSFLFCQMSAYR